MPRGVPPPVGLCALPHSFEGLFHDSAHLACGVCAATPPSSRGLCLVCGACVCGLETPRRALCMVSHSQHCGAGAALFILANKSAVLLVRDKRVMLRGSPYRDAHGEVDLDLQRGKPLWLHAEDYATLARQWLTLNFDEAIRDPEIEFGVQF